MVALGAVDPGGRGGVDEHVEDGDGLHQREGGVGDDLVGDGDVAAEDARVAFAQGLGGCEGYGLAGGGEGGFGDGVVLLGLRLEGKLVVCWWSSEGEAGGVRGEEEEEDDDREGVCVGWATLREVGVSGAYLGVELELDDATRCGNDLLGPV